MKWQPINAASGDMIRVRIGAIYHYGVFVSEEEVIAFGMPPVPEYDGHPLRFTVCAVDVDTFSCQKIVETAVFDRQEAKTRIPPQQAVAAARARLGETGYNLIHNNCEHFAFSCVLGKKHCQQEEDARRRWAARPVCDLYLMEIPAQPWEQPLLPAAREREIRACTHAGLRAAKQADWRLLQFAARRSLGLETDSLVFRRTAHGKWLCSGFEFSLSHTEKLVAAAVSNAPVGVDVETVGERVARWGPDRIEAVRRRVYTAAEQAAFPHTAEGFLQAWTRKEAVFKQKGKGAFRPRAIDATKWDGLTFTIAEQPETVISVCGENSRRLRVYVTDLAETHLTDPQILSVQTGEDR